MKDKVYYDENCYVCSLEINAIRNRGEACGIEFVDISSDEFKTDGRDYDSEMVGEFDGEETIGIETFRKMYETMGFSRAVDDRDWETNSIPQASPRFLIA